MNHPVYPVGKLPVDVLKQVLNRAPVRDSRVIVGPGIGIDCAVLDMGDQALVIKTDPITFVTGEIGWYLVQINANDIATTGAAPRWLMVTMLLPEGKTTPELIDQISEQVNAACQKLNISVIGGHTEITYALDRPILVGTMMGEVAKENLLTTRGALPGDRILLTKGVPIEATAILAREFPHKLEEVLSPEQIEQAANYLHDPGINVVRDARVALEAGHVTTMHDPTEGGLASALWEVALASGHKLVFSPQAVPVPELSAIICQTFQIDPLSAIASGALLLTARPESAPQILQAEAEAGILCADIGEVQEGEASVWMRTDQGESLLPHPKRDEIARLFSETTS